MVDLELEFQKFASGASEGSAIKDIYNIIPSLNKNQIMICSQLMYFIRKYNDDSLRSMLEDFLKSSKENKSLGFLSSMTAKNFLKAYTQEELIKGINLRGANRDKEQV